MAIVHDGLNSRGATRPRRTGNGSRIRSSRGSYRCAGSILAAWCGTALTDGRWLDLSKGCCRNAHRTDGQERRPLGASSLSARHGILLRRPIKSTFIYMRLVWVSLQRRSPRTSQIFGVGEFFFICVWSLFGANFPDVVVNALRRSARCRIHDH